MEQLTKNQAVATSQEAVQNQNEPQLRDENAHNDKSVHGVLNPTYQAGLRRDAVQPDIEAERKKRDEIEAGKSYCSRRFGGATCDDKSAQIYARFDKNDWRISNVPNPDEAVPSFVSGAMAKAGKGLLEGTLQACTSAVSDKLLDLVGLGGKSAADKGKDTRDYLAAAFPELNAWERAGADASSAGMVDAGFENQKELTKMQLDNQKEIAEMQNETQKEIAGIQSATSRQNTKDQVYAQNE